MILRLTIPGRVVTGNASFRWGKGHGYTDQEARDYKKRVYDISFAAAAKSKWKPLDCHCAVTVRAYNTRADIDGLCKILFDGMQGPVYLNDKLIKEMHVYIEENGDPRVEVEAKKRT